VLRATLGPRDPAHPLVDQGHELIEGVAVALVVRLQETGDRPSIWRDS
jgi:hypothetical protein